MFEQLTAENTLQRRGITGHYGFVAGANRAVNGLRQSGNIACATGRLLVRLRGIAVDRCLFLTIARTCMQQTVAHDGYTRDDRRQTDSEYAQRTAATVLTGPISAIVLRQSRHGCALGLTISAGVFAQCSRAQVGNDTLGIHWLARNRMLDRIVNNGRRLAKTIVAIGKAKLSQHLVHVQNVRELT